MLLALALAPALLWDGGPQTAPLLEKAGIHEIAVAGDASGWAATSVKARSVDPESFVKLPAPGIDFQAGRAGATAAPWVRSNLWRMIRDASKPFLYEVTGPAVSLAIAEAGATSAETYFRIKPEDLDTFHQGVAFLQQLDTGKLPVRANFGLVDDGTPLSGEVMNLLIRRNLLFQPVAAAANFKGPVIRLGSAEYPSDLATDPYKFAGVVRSRVGDDQRIVRIYGTETALARIYGDAHHARLHLIQFSKASISGVRVRVLGRYPRVVIASLGSRVMPAEDVVVDGTGTEFSIPDLKTYAVVDLDSKSPGELISKYSDRDFELTADPNAPVWRGTTPVKIATDAFASALPFGATEVRSRWTHGALYLLYSCPYTALNLKPAPDMSEETQQLWNWDVAEAFIGADITNIGAYREYQVSPQGEWIDLDIDVEQPKPDGGASWNSGMKVKARIDQARKVWYGEMRIPFQSIAARDFHPGNRLRLGLFRISGTEPDRSLAAWQPSFRRNFHVPEAFGTLVLN